MLLRNNCLELDGVCSCSICMLCSGNFRFQSVSLFRTFSCIAHTVAIDCTKLCVAFRFNLININFFFVMFLPPSFHFYFSRFRMDLSNRIGSLKVQSLGNFSVSPSQQSALLHNKYKGQNFIVFFPSREVQ